MMRGSAWVIGEGGLLGTRVRRALNQSGGLLRPWDHPERPLLWHDEAQLREQLQRSATAFGAQVGTSGRPWALFWCAGVGIVGADQGVLDIERIALECLLEALGRSAATSSGVPGVVFLSSSAGGIYGDSADLPITEQSKPQPISPYGRHKLALEGLLSSWAANQPAVTSFIGRISNLYGVGQNPLKPQGLISHMSRSIVLSKPLNIYMPIDTIRDYLFAEDCGSAVVECVDHLLARARSVGDTTGVTKILAAERTASIACILGIFASLTRYRPRYLCHANPSAALQPRRLQFRSSVLRNVVTVGRTDLSIGIQQVHQKNISDFLRGRLRPSLARVSCS